MSKSNGYFCIEKEVGADVEKELKKIAKAIVTANNKIAKLGYSSYLSAGGTWNIVDGKTHIGTRAERNDSCVVATFSVSNIDAGDW